MAVSAGGEVVGNVSGGFVEGAVYELAQQLISTGEPVRHTYAGEAPDVRSRHSTAQFIISVDRALPYVRASV
jgi:xanthine/CO dehydrogenase XdhC/CoxF family maturation factor